MREALRVSVLSVSAFVMTFGQTPPVPRTPAPIQALLYARPFQLGEGFRYDWLRPRPVVREGFVVVLEVDPDLVYPRQTAQPVLYVGDGTAMRLNVGYVSGKVIALVPGQADLHRIWFGTPRLPEAVTEAIVEEEKAAAEAAGLAALPNDQVSSALAQGGETLLLPGINALWAEVAKLVVQYAPDEKSLAEILASQ